MSRALMARWANACVHVHAQLVFCWWFENDWTLTCSAADACLCVNSKYLTSLDRYEYGQINFFLPLLLQTGKYHRCQYSKSIRLWSMRLHCASVTLVRCWSRPCGRAMDLKRLYALDDFSAITIWAKAINLLRVFHLRPKHKSSQSVPSFRDLTHLVRCKATKLETPAQFCHFLFPISGCHLKS